MAMPAYMSITGETQGLITENAFTALSVGNTYQEGHEDDRLQLLIGSQFQQKKLIHCGDVLHCLEKANDGDN